MQWKISWQWERVLLVFKRKVNRGKETSIGSFQDETEVIFVWYWAYTDGKKLMYMKQFSFFSCVDESGQYHSTCVVERVIVLGFGKQPTLVTASSKGNELTSILLQFFEILLLCCHSLEESDWQVCRGSVTAQEASLFSFLHYILISRKEFSERRQQLFTTNTTCRTEEHWLWKMINTSVKMVWNEQVQTMLSCTQHEQRWHFKWRPICSGLSTCLV